MIENKDTIHHHYNLTKEHTKIEKRKAIPDSLSVAMLIFSHPPPALPPILPLRTQNLILLRYLRSSGGGGTLQLVHAVLNKVLDLLDGCTGREVGGVGREKNRRRISLKCQIKLEWLTCSATSTQSIIFAVCKCTCVGVAHSKALWPAPPKYKYRALPYVDKSQGIAQCRSPRFRHDTMVGGFRQNSGADEHPCRRMGEETSTRVRTVALHAALLYEEGGADGHSHHDERAHDDGRLGVALGHCCWCVREKLCVCACVGKRRGTWRPGGKGKRNKALAHLVKCGQRLGLQDVKAMPSARNGADRVELVKRTRVASVALIRGRAVGMTQAQKARRYFVWAGMTAAQF